MDLGNLVNDQFTSSLFGTAEIQFYPLARNADAARTADMVLPLASDPTGGTAFLSTTTDTLAKTFTLPTNVEKAFIDVVSESQSNDEFWYTCVPNDVATELQSCGGTGFRESESRLMAYLPAWPRFIRGSIPVALIRCCGVRFPECRRSILHPIALTSRLSRVCSAMDSLDQVSVSVFNANSGFSTTATLLVFQDHGSQQVTGEVTRNTIGAPIPA